MPLSRMRPRVGIVKARHQVGHRRLARAAAADQRDHRSAGHGDVEVAHHRPALAVLELDVLEPDLVHDARRVARVGPVGLVVLHRQHLEHALHRRQRPLQLGERVDDVPDRVQQQERVPLERHDVADRGAADDVQVAAVPDDHDVDRAERAGPTTSTAPARGDARTAPCAAPCAARACSRAARASRGRTRARRGCPRTSRRRGRRSAPTSLRTER